MKKTAIFGLARLLRRPWRSATTGGTGCRQARRRPRRLRERVPQRADPEPDEVRGADELERGEGRLRRAQHRDDARARGQRPRRLAERDPGAVATPFLRAAGERVADRERRVLAGRADHRGRDAEEGEELHA